MAFLAPLAATAVGSLFANKLAKAGTGPTKLEQPVLNQDAQAQKTGLGIGTSLAPQGQNLINMGAQGYQPVLNYWSSILSNNRGAATSALAPEISRIGQGYQSATQTSTALNPRGGTSAEFNAEAPYAQQHDVSTLLQTARPAAATSLLQGSQSATSAGAGVLSNAVSAIYGSTPAGRDILQQQQQSRAQQTQNSKSIGQGLFDLIQKYGPQMQSKIGGLFGGSGGGGNTTLDTSGGMSNP